MESIDNMIQKAESLLQAGMNRDMSEINAEELGEVADIFKDLHEAKYYCSLTKAMEKRSESDSTKEKIDNAIMVERIRNQAENGQNYFSTIYPRYPYMWRDGYSDGRMYYDGSGNGGNTGNMSNGGMRSYTDRSYPNYNTSYTSVPSNMRDYREGRSYIGRRGYMESQQSHEPDSVKMEKLEEYIKELGEDITEMIRDATPAERNTIQDKLMRLAQQIE